MVIISDIEPTDYLNHLCLLCSYRKHTIDGVLMRTKMKNVWKMLIHDFQLV